MREKCIFLKILLYRKRSTTTQRKCGLSCSQESRSVGKLLEPDHSCSMWASFNIKFFLELLFSLAVFLRMAMLSEALRAQSLFLHAFLSQGLLPPHGLKVFPAFSCFLSFYSSSGLPLNKSPVCLIPFRCLLLEPELMHSPDSEEWWLFPSFKSFPLL